MFYETGTNDHGLPHDPFKALVSPRPIGWIGTLAGDGTPNLAPYSYFNAIGDRPKMVMFASDGRKDSVANIEETGEFSASLASRVLAEKVIATSVDAPAHIDEFQYSGLTATAGKLISAPHVAEAFAALECKAVSIFQPDTLEGGKSKSIVVIGQVVGIHIDEGIIADGRIDMAKAAPLARLGYRDHSHGADTFELIRPVWTEKD
ncbi:flavin reductase family protein [Hoeflea prorocentri]|uniref:Flavin reductase family protein n=1 Tax=Hoeflea prorocentri TaxID=1922333 RepID=A0A9X3UHD0_9HYPH|nr:flavin reductase family protein [Hoeflea prorocentri]MCY6380679.1 flavin reductase family protein [Hoeflea prorocentri]MDA5398479.1 flavin reductase family protein [Hoeflea prorocentri]